MPAKMHRRTFLVGGQTAIFAVLAAPLSAQQGQVLAAGEAFDALLADKMRIIDVRSREEWQETGVGSGVWPISMHEGRFAERLFAAKLVRVGLLESDARELGHEVEVNWTDASGWYSQKRTGETHAAAKFVYEAGTGRILGAHLFGPGYAELANIVGLAMRLDLTTKDLKRMVNAYPSTGSDLGSLL
ncbi:hypothetical protein [Mesobacterium pallidum]|uniref:hypothetical protein n=1 Tax=Mesobacterium pallidum TaxID=2872037 RepID=UPI001EE1ACC0|nr:hypothetical protein [Mesobacterium pallidum]